MKYWPFVLCNRRLLYQYVINNNLAMIQYRQNPVIEKLSDEKCRSLFSNELHKLVELFRRNNFEIRIAGGAVRDILMGLRPIDYDFATTATPTQMKNMFEREQVRLINANGEKHGTITARLNDKENFEITTLRIDVITDGRHAEVEFTTNWLLDAYRRDLTINSMFLDIDGHIFDYFYGFEDLRDNRIRFVGDPDSRIKADFLRILRYFRFFGRISKHSHSHDQDVLDAIRKNVDGISIVSGERIWMEFKKILEGNFAGDILKTMLDVGITTQIGLPKSCNISELDSLLKRSKIKELHGASLLSALLHDEKEVIDLHKRLKFSTFERDLIHFIVTYRHIRNPSLLTFKKFLLNSKSKSAHLRKWVEQLLIYRNEIDYLQQFQSWQMPPFPLKGQIVAEKFGIKSGRLLGQVIGQLKELWADENFSVDGDWLLTQVPRILKDFEIKSQVGGTVNG